MCHCVALGGCVSIVYIAHRCSGMSDEVLLLFYAALAAGVMVGACIALWGWSGWSRQGDWFLGSCRGCTAVRNSGQTAWWWMAGWCLVTVCSVGSSSAPVSAKVLLVGSTAKPVEMHVHSFGSFRLDDVGDNAKGCGVVGLYESGWLGMAHFYEEVSLENGFSYVYV